MESASALRDYIERDRTAGRDASVEVWEMIETAASGVLRGCLTASRLDPSHGEDLRQELFLHLFGVESSCLDVFRGESAAEFSGFIRTIASRFARRYLRRLRMRHIREYEAIRRRPLPQSGGPSEMQLRSAIAELEMLMPDVDRARLRILRARDGGSDGTGAAPECRHDRSSRTQRRWAEDLKRRYADRVI